MFGITVIFLEFGNLKFPPSGVKLTYISPTLKNNTDIAFGFITKKYISE